MANILSIGTALPQYRHNQSDILHFMQQAYHLNSDDARKLAFMYKQSEIQSRYSVLKDFSCPPAEWSGLATGAENSALSERMEIFENHAARLSIDAIENSIQGIIEPGQITHLITVSCTGLSAPGLDLQIAEAMNLPADVYRTSVNFMGCYAAIHGLKMAKMICDGVKEANVMVVCTELCTIHFQPEFTADNAASALLFADGSAAVLVSNQRREGSLHLKGFYSEVSYKGKNDMSWQVTEKGFLMRLSSYVPQFIQEDIASLVEKALAKGGIRQEDIGYWCLHPGGKKILEVIQNQLHLTANDLSCAKKVLANYGNMSSPTILFVLKEIMELSPAPVANIFGVAFGPGLTMETFIASA